MHDPTIDYRVDPGKLRFLQGPTWLATSPPNQCQARRAHVVKWTILERFIRLFRDRSKDREERRSHYYAERCNRFDGHWEHEGQREHINGWGDRWPVTAAETARLNPDPELPCAHGMPLYKELNQSGRPGWRLEYCARCFCVLGVHGNVPAEEFSLLAHARAVAAAYYRQDSG